MNAACRLARALALALFLTAPPTATGAWTHYRGNTHDGTYPGAIRTNWTEVPPRRVWRRAIEPGLSSLTLDGGRVLTQARRPVGDAQREFVVALDAATGAELWARNLDLADYPHGGVGFDDGPRSTPVIEGDRVYVFTSYLKLYCLDVRTGEEIWRRDFPADLGATVIPWQNAASPVLVGDLVVVNANAGSRRLLGLRKSDGFTVWREHDHAMTQATPVVATLGGVEQVIFFAQTGLVSVRPESGALLWRFPFPYSTSTAASPVVAGDRVFCSAAYGSGSGVVRIQPQPSGEGLTATEVWKRRAWSQIHWASPVQHEDHVYAVVGQSFLSLRCLDLATGDIRWEALGGSDARSIGYGSVLKAGGDLLVLTDSGRVALAELDPGAYREIDSFRAFDGNPKCWNNAAMDDGILYVRSTLEVAAFDLRPAVAPSGPLRLVAERPGVPEAGGVRLLAQATEGSPLDASRAERIRLWSTTNLLAPAAGWSEETAPSILEAGRLVFEVPRRDGDRQRFFRVAEGP